jgi:hypothetical protein
MDKTAEYLKRFINGVKKRNPGEKEFHQAVSEVATPISPTSRFITRCRSWNAWPSRTGS